MAPNAALIGSAEGTVVFLYDYKGPPSVQGCSGLLKYSVDCLF